MNMPNDQTDLAVQVTVGAVRLLRTAGAFTIPALIAGLDWTGWHDDEVSDVLDVLVDKGYVRRVVLQEPCDVFVPGWRAL